MGADGTACAAGGDLARGSARTEGGPTLKPVVAAFDFDGTLSEGVSGLRFFHQVVGTPRYAWFWVRHLPSLFAYGRRWRHEESLDRINRHIFRGLPVAEVAAAADYYWRHTLPRYLAPACMARLHAHLARGDRCVIVSRGYEVYLRPWAQSLGIGDVISTRLEAGPDGRLTGAMPEPSCDGEYKPARLLRLLGPRENYELHAYGDGPGDFALLAAADCAFVRHGRGFKPWRAAAT
jgi:phosphatidylglycerophosphatase C